MLALWWPVVLIVVADVIYQICAKKLSSVASPLAALGATYLVSALTCVLLFEALSPAGDLMAALAAVPFPAAVAGVSIAGLEVGTIYMYRAGWPMNVGFIVYTGIIVVLLLFIGSCIYTEPMGLMKLAGVALTCLVLFAFQHANPGDLFIQKSDASTIGDLAKAVQQLFGDTGTNIIGTRHGEKLFETLMTREERLRSQDMGHYFRVAADNRDLNYDKFVVNGEVHTMADESYTSHNTTRLDVEGTVKKILTTEYVQNALKGIPNV